MSILSGFVKHKRYHTNDDYTKSIISEWTREETVEMNDGTRTLNDIMDATHNKLNYGQGTVANSDNQTVLGKYNITDNNNTYARITGGGTPATPQNIETLDWNGNVKFAGTITTGNNINLNNVLLLAHPVGSYYWSSENINPSQLFGGTWVAVTDKFILAAGSQFPIDSTPTGSATTGFTYNGATDGHQLIYSEMPEHNHTYDKAVGASSHVLTQDEIPSHTHALGSNASGTTSEDGAHTHDSVFPLPIPAPGGTDDSHPIEIIQTDEQGHPTTTLRDTSEDGSHTHTVTLSGTTESRGGSQGHTHDISSVSTNTGYKGGSNPHAHDINMTVTGIPNMPPYEIAYCWRRTA